ncbi:unnamed protein product [Rotaria sp. Silwood1]|nr:unnamed protein product [Rotaria sp. Silwood1]CAF3660928.1 unnamed protein product [Rotaria sp. Silwood1]CAF3680754.1 unnamed protein product [Rotaria sp. Silwood1]
MGRFKKTIDGQVKKVKHSNVTKIAHELFKYNIIRGRGLLAKAIIKAQIKSPYSTPVYAALTSMINSKFPQIGQLICKRLISSFRKAHMDDEKTKCFAEAKFLAHLINQRVLHEIIALQILLFLFENRTDDNIILAIESLKECGQKLSTVSPQELYTIYLVLKNLLQEPSLNKQTQDMIQDLFTIRRDGFETYPAIQYGLDLVDKNYQYTHILLLNNSYDSEKMLDQFQYDEEYKVNENKYKQSRKKILVNNSDNENESSSNSSDSDEKDNDNEKRQQPTNVDRTEADLLIHHHKIFLIIQASIDAEKCASKLHKMNSYGRRDDKLCEMIVDICTKQHTYEDFFGIYLKNLLLELFHFLGFTELKNRLTDPTITKLLQHHCLRDNPENTRFCIKFFTSTGLGRITDKLQAGLAR